MVEEKNQIEEYRYPLIVIGGSVLVVIVLTFLVGRPLYLSMQKTSAELEDRREVKERLEEKLANLRSLESKEEELKEQNKKVLAALPEDKEVSRLFVQFEKIATESGVTIDSVSESGEASQEATGPIVPVTYNVTGNSSDYGSLKKALSRFEGALRLLSINSINATLSEESLSLSFTVNTYKRGQ